MKSSLWVILLVLISIVSFIIGYSLAPTEVDVVRHTIGSGQKAASGGEGTSGGYGTPAAGGYGAPAGGYGAPAGGYG
ncbi:MAG: hypothetical protein JSV13_00940, partial [Nitrospiraceae bacterium]